MGHLLMVESWVGAMSTLLPRAILEAGHRFTFLTRDLHHYLRAPAGAVPHPLLAADNVVTEETNDVPALLDRVERLHEVFGFDGVISSCDYYLGTVARIGAHLGLPGAKPEAVERAYRKDLTREALRGAGLAGPAFAVTSGWAETSARAEEIGYPLVIKPVDLCAGMYVRKVGDREQLRDAYLALEGFPVNARRQTRTPLVLLEELLTGPEISVETVAFEGETTVIGVTDKSVTGEPWFVESGHMFPAALDPDVTRAAGETALAALAAVGLDHGVAHTELKLTPDGPKVVEINPRPAGNQITELVRRVTGVDIPMAYAQLALGERPRLTPAETGVRSAAIAFLIPPRPGTLSAVHGTGRLAEAGDVVEWRVKDPGFRAGEGTSNNDYLGHVMVADTSGPGARSRAEELVAALTVEYA
ncbi:argininosuccinate lyase [Streptosporangium becharense]|uniref:Argininosuccinate lyase n=1 Tax=Streptosporangium becharense TaxID=1816182 RepID=A0A7W9IGL7_9ACTN|nr:ATP-grasp domain-containing protein [Streptosporangium becharense]MBB2914790.1 argininosuccinate lyase [Streptosporangium becharense]MBB5820399.1 argininosuccinate lyase [Streptosporangium becharense]